MCIVIGDSDSSDLVTMGEYTRNRKKWLVHGYNIRVPTPKVTNNHRKKCMQNKQNLKKILLKFQLLLRSFCGVAAIQPMSSEKRLYRLTDGLLELTSLLYIRLPSG